MPASGFGRAVRRLAAGLALTLVATGGAAGEPRTTLRPMLEVLDAEGAVIFAQAMGPETRWCLVWNHSVTGIEVQDCFAQATGRLVLERSHQPDFAAGLGHIPGRGVVVSDGSGGYWIEDLDMEMPDDALLLRVGGPRVDHRLLIGGVEHSLSAIAAGARVTVRMRFDGKVAGARGTGG